MTKYVFSLTVQRTTREPGYSGGFDTLTKEFDTLHELIEWRDIYDTVPPASAGNGWVPAEVSKWLGDNSFPAIIGVCEYKCFEVTTTELDMEKCHL